MYRYGKIHASVIAHLDAKDLFHRHTDWQLDVYSLHTPFARAMPEYLKFDESITIHRSLSPLPCVSQTLGWLESRRHESPLGGTHHSIRMSITSYSEPYKLDGKFQFPEYYDFFQKAIASVWRPEEVSMSTDVTDWQEATEEERAVIGGILRGFTQLELHVACYWGDVVTKFFPKHEVQAMARAFSCSEAVHAAAYSHLSDTLGLDDFEAFLG